MTQYDNLGSSYDAFDDLPYRAMEEFNVLRALRPLVQPTSKILDLACGTGFYSSRLVSLGAASVTGMDISSVMLEAAATRMPSDVESGRVRFVVGDGTKPESYAPDGSPGHFDLAFGGWFINYAKSMAELVAMYKNIALNLKPGGVFVGIVPHPTNDIEKRAETISKRPFIDTLPRHVLTKPLESGDGWEMRAYITNTGVDFTAYQLRKEIFEKAARSAGLNGRLEWKREELLGEEWRKTYIPDATEEEWKLREENPYAGILMVWKD
ncbi:Demethylmenaquinone methyltransferase [Cladobotryum mycophilum]|uniref:Demethylmenaquinone methyltransferase n=1 Tax=Cladobotryum mycophilum TaxID=491253 RepID=A0ABR0SIV4_9HYPO